MKIYDTIIIGGGQAGLSVAYFLRRHKIDYLVLDNQQKAGGAWLQTWDSLRLFSPVTYSSLSGWGMPQGKEEYPTKNDFIQYLEAYEQRYQLAIERNIDVQQVTKEGYLFKLETNDQTYYAKTVVSATGTSRHPFIPTYPNQEQFMGQQLHSVDYKNTDKLHDKNVLIVGGGNSGAQILAEVSKVATTKWVTLEEPYFLPEHIDGRYLFNEATRKFYGQASADPNAKKVSLSNIVQVATVKEALERNAMNAARPFQSFYEQGVVWPNGQQEEFDIVIWCTGFKANLKHLESLNIIDNNRIQTDHTRVRKEPQLWTVGYGNWTGFASATIYGVGKTARRTAKEIAEYLAV